MSDHDTPIMPSDKVAARLDHYPALEDVLIGMAPPFKKLKNPILRKSVAKVATLPQAAAVGRIPVEQMVNELRAVALYLPSNGRWRAIQSCRDLRNRGLCGT